MSSSTKTTTKGRNQMPIIDFTPEHAYSLNDPLKSNKTLFRIEDARGCNGTCVGGKARFDPATGDIVPLRPHDRHLVMSGEDPKAGPRYTAVYPPEEREEIK